MILIPASLEDRRRMVIATLHLYHDRGAVITDDVVFAAIDDQVLDGVEGDAAELSSLVWTQIAQHQES